MARKTAEPQFKRPPSGRRRKMPKGYISHTQARTFMQCGRFYKLKYIDKRQPESSYIMKRGSVMHTALKELNDLAAAGADQLAYDDVQRAFRKALRAETGPGEIGARDVQEMLQSLQLITEDIQDTASTLVEAECEVEVDFQRGLKLLVIIDRIDTWGDDGLELSQIYMLAAVPYFFTVVLLTARFFSPAKERGLWKAFKKNFQDPVSLLPLGAILAGLSLTALGVPFPSILQLPRRLVVYATVAAFSASFGLNMYVRRMLGNVIRLVGMLPIKFLLAPAAGFLISLALGYSLNTNPLALKVVIIQSTMPVAIWSVLACKLFDLDDNYAIGLWILTTLCVIFLLPLYSWIAAL